MCGIRSIKLSQIKFINILAINLVIFVIVLYKFRVRNKKLPLDPDDKNFLKLTFKLWEDLSTKEKQF